MDTRRLRPHGCRLGSAPPHSEGTAAIDETNRIVPRSPDQHPSETRMLLTRPAWMLSQ